MQVSADSQGKARKLSTSYSPRAEPALAGSRRSLLMHVAARMHAADGPRAVHKATATQSHPETVLSRRPLRTLLPLEAGVLTVRYRHQQGFTVRAARRTVLLRSSVLCAVWH